MMDRGIENVFAEALAQANTADVAHFLNRFAVVVEGLCRNSNYGGIGMWQLSVAERLDKETARFFSEICRTREYCEESELRETLKRNELREEIRELEKEKSSLQEAS